MHRAHLRSNGAGLHSSLMNCPNCDSPVQRDPVVCDVCGYRSDLAREFFWLYIGGTLLAFVGFALGACGVLIDESGRDHWSRALAAWYPLGLWPEAHHWMAFLVSGILVTLGGMGLTRRRRSAWFLLTVIVAYQLLWSAATLLGFGGGDVPVTWPAALPAFNVLLAVLLARIGVALRRTPPRDAAQMQKLASVKTDGDATNQKSCNSDDQG